MKKLLIIGGSGFFGKSILDGYLRGLLEPWNISSISILSRHASNLRIAAPELMHPSISLIDADITTCTTLPLADFVIHAAASTDIVNYLDRPLQEQENIQRGTYNYCELAKNFHQKSKILYVSSGAVYGKQPENLEEIPEDFDPGPIKLMEAGKRHYAAAKRDAEIPIKQLGGEGLHVSIARCFAFVGKHLPRNKHFAIGNFIRDGIAREAIKVRATYPVYRSYMYADDLVEWLMTIAHASNSECPIFNVGSSEAIEIRQLAKKVGNYFGVDTDISEIMSAESDRYIPLVEKAFKELGLRAKYDLSSAISETIKQIKGLKNI
jgi:nucleoside-diphosphate-sugar epimerase